MKRKQSLIHDVLLILAIGLERIETMPRAKFVMTEKRKRALAKAQKVAYERKAVEKFKKALERKRILRNERPKFSISEVF
jgi:hypothetical protein